MAHSPSEPSVVARAAARPVDTPRAMQALCAVLCAGVLVVAAWLKPDPRGLGTHEQLLFPPCAFHRLTGLPCPGCGLTTAFAATVRLRFAEAFWASPFGLLLCVAVAGFGLFSLIALVTNWGAWSHLHRLESPAFLWPVFALLFGSWAFKILTTVLRVK